MDSWGSWMPTCYLCGLAVVEASDDGGCYGAWVLTDRGFIFHTACDERRTDEGRLGRSYAVA